MFIIGHAHDVSFKVSVLGTSAEPSVRLVLGCTPELSFPARKVGDEWTATIVIPTGISACKCDLRVEVLVNNRLFTPLVKRVELVSQTEELEVETPPTLPAVPPVESVPTEIPEPAAALDPATIPADGEIAFTTKVREGERLSLLKQMAEDKPKKHSPFVHTPLPAPSDVKVEPIKVSMADIMKVAEAKEPVVKPKRATKATKATKAIKPLVEIKQETPIRLVKGPIIYE